MHAASLLDAPSSDCRAFWATSNSTTFVPPAVRVPQKQWVPIVRSSYTRNFTQPPNERPASRAFQSRAQSTYTAPPAGRPQPANTAGPSRSGYSLNHEKMPVVPSTATTSFVPPPRPLAESHGPVAAAIDDGYTYNLRVLPDHPSHSTPSEVKDSSYEAANKRLLRDHVHLATAPSSSLPHIKTGYARIEYHRPGPSHMGSEGVPVVGFGPMDEPEPLQTAIAAVTQSVSHNSFLPPSAYQPVVSVLSPKAAATYMNPPMSPIAFSPNNALVSPHKLGKSKSQPAFTFSAAARHEDEPDQHILAKHPIPMPPVHFQSVADQAERQQQTSTLPVPPFLTTVTKPSVSLTVTTTDDAPAQPLLPQIYEQHVAHKHRNPAALAPSPSMPKFERSGFSHNHRRDVWQPLDVKPNEKGHVPPEKHILSPVASVVSPFKKSHKEQTSTDSVPVSTDKVAEHDESHHKRALVPPVDPNMKMLPPAEQFSSTSTVTYVPPSYELDRQEISRVVTACSPQVLRVVRKDRVVVEAKALSASTSKAPTGYDMVTRSADPITCHAIGFDPSAVSGSRGRILAKTRPAECEDRHAHKSAHSKRKQSAKPTAAPQTAAPVPVDPSVLQEQLQKQQQQQAELRQRLEEKLTQLRHHQQLNAQNKIF